MKVATTSPTFNARKGSGKKVHFYNQQNQWCGSGKVGIGYKKESFNIRMTSDPVDCKKCLESIQENLEIGLKFANWLINNPAPILECANPVSWAQKLEAEVKALKRVNRQDFEGWRELHRAYEGYYRSYFYGLLITTPRAEWESLLKRELLNGDSGLWKIAE